jgi:hypothetical protein
MDMSLVIHSCWFITNVKLTLKEWYQNKINSTKSIPENATINTVITTVTATDKDPDSAGVVWYKLKPDVF